MVEQLTAAAALCVARMSSDVNVVSFAQCRLRVIRVRTGSAIPFESARVIFAGDGAHLCTLPLHGARIHQGWTENPRTRRRVLKQPFEIGYQPEGPLMAARSIAYRMAYRKILLVGRSWSGDNCSGNSDGHATASTLGSRHVPVSKPSRAAAGGASACVGH